VSEVVVTAPIPIRKAKAEYGSISKVKGISRAMPTIPPRPGITPIVNPTSTPAANTMRRAGSSMMLRADIANSSALKSNSVSSGAQVFPGGEQYGALLCPEFIDCY
jgi:hypothetical protein